MAILQILLKRKPAWASARIQPKDLARRIANLAGVLLLVLSLHVGAMVALEGLSIGDAVWLTVTSATTVGYGDLSAQTTPGRIITTLLIYIAGIALLAQVAGLWFEYRQERRHRMVTGQWSWHMDNHIVFVNCPEDADQRYFEYVLASIRESCETRRDAEVVLIDEKFAAGLPDPLVERGAVLVALPLTDPRALEHAAVARAETVVVMSRDRADAMSDAVVFALVDEIRTLNDRAWILAEVVDDAHRARIVAAGANSTLRPVRGYPEMVARAILSHKSEHVLENLFDSSGEECIRLEASASATWGEVVRAFLDRDAGCPIAYEAPDGRVVTNPSTRHAFEATALFVVVNPSQQPRASSFAVGGRLTISGATAT